MFLIGLDRKEDERRENLRGCKSKAAKAKRMADLSRKRSGESPGNAIIGQSGGPTVVMNQSLVGAVLEVRRHSKIGRLYGALHGAKGILNQDIVDLSMRRAGNSTTTACAKRSSMATAPS